MDKKITEAEKQDRYKNARTQDWYDSIWKTVGKCVFCDLKDKYILHEENGVVLTINIFPYIDGQMMAIPRRHVKSTNELTVLEWETMRKFGYIAKKLFKKVHKHKAMWSLVKTGVLAQGTVADHLHMHFIPFDQTDLAMWNYRDLKFAPLENVGLYKKQVKEFFKSKIKFEEKYETKTSLDIICDVVIQNENEEILFQERKEEYKFDPDILTLPGGHVDNPRNGLINELAREVKEEIGLDINITDLKLVDSRVSYLKLKEKSKYMKVKYPYKKEFLWNTYFLKIKNSEIKNLVAGDDCEKIIWLDLKELNNNERITKEIKSLLKILPN